MASGSGGGGGGRGGRSGGGSAAGKRFDNMTQAINERNKLNTQISKLLDSQDKARQAGNDRQVTALQRRIDSVLQQMNAAEDAITAFAEDELPF